MASPEKVAFCADDSIVRYLIQSQAGTIEKAADELVMNGVDGGATRIDVNLIDLKTIEVIDNGCGFKSRDEIMEMFRSFGFDHTTKQQMEKGRLYGKFGLGRGQAMAFGKTRWLTNAFEMTTDIRNNEDTCFFLTEHDTVQHKGLKVIIDLYEPCSRMEIENLRRSIKQHLAFVECAIFLDGERINEDVETFKWTEVTDTLRFKQKPNAQTGVDVYNMGVFVRNYSHQQFGVSGVLVSKAGSPFELNMARNDVLQSCCSLFKDAKALLKTYAEKRQSRKSITDEDRYYMVQQLMAGEAKDDVLKRRLFKDITGKYHSLAMLNDHAEGKVALSKRNNDQASENVHNSEVTFVLAPVTGEWLNAEDESALADKLESIRRRYLNCVNGLKHAFKPTNLKALREAYVGDLVNVPADKWTKKERVYVAGVQAVSKDLMYAVRFGARQFMDFDRSELPRRIVLGESDNRAQAWTDGAFSITIDRQYLKNCVDDGVDGIHRLLAVMIHEYLHTDSDESSHVHSPEFFEAYEAVITSQHYRPYAFIDTLLKAIDKASKKEKMTRSNVLLRSMDKAETIIGEQLALAI